MLTLDYYPSILCTQLTYSAWLLSQCDFVWELERSLYEWDHEVGDSECSLNYMEGGSSSSGDPTQQHSCSFEELGEILSLKES